MRPHKGSLALAVLLILCRTLGAQTGEGGEEAARSLEPFWRQALGGSVIGVPSAQAGSVVMVCEGGMLKAFSWQGQPLWTYTTRGRFAPFVTRSREGTSYVSRTNGALIAVNRTGRELWQLSLGENLSWPVLSGWDGRIFVFTGKRIACYTAAGRLLWRRTLESPPALEPVLDQRGGFITVLENGDLLRADPFGAFSFRRLTAIPAAILSLRPSGGREPSIFIAYANGSLELAAENSQPAPKVLETVLPGRPLAAAAREGHIALTLEDGRLILIEGSGGKILWTGRSHITAGEISGRAGEIAMIYDERGIYVLTKNGAAGFAEDGRRFWVIRVNGSPALPAFSDEGVLYSGGGDWILYAYRPEERVRSQRQSLYGPAPEGSYGLGNPPPSSQADYPFRFDEDELNRRMDRIREDIELGRVGENERDHVAWLMEVAGSLPNPVPSGSPAVQVRHRAEAARLLAFLGSRETIPFLANLFNRDPDPSVKAAAAEAIGRIGVDPEGRAIRAFTNAVFPPAPIGDSQVLSAIAAATGALCRFSGPPLSEAGIHILSALGADSRPPAVKAQARKELESLR
jgi:outer membrane protein assembly factor BamB